MHEKFCSCCESTGRVAPNYAWRCYDVWTQLCTCTGGNQQIWEWNNPTACSGGCATCVQPGQGESLGGC
jgi:hypothetical protein